MPKHDSKVPRVIMLTGKVGCGKGTQAQLLAKELGYVVYSTGDKFREFRERQDQVGERVREEYDAGRWMPYWFASYLFMEAIFTILPKEKGVIFEGTGRRLHEAELVDDVLNWLGESYKVLYLDIKDETAIDRVVKRSRGDALDDPEKTKRRLADYTNHTVPVIDFFKDKGMLVEIDGERSVEDIYKDVRKAVLGE